MFREITMCMWMYLLFGILMIGCLGLWLSHITLNRRPPDSALKQRAIFSIQQQLTYVRLKKLLPEQHVLVHVSFDALLTTKYPRTRHKYRNMVADFVLLDQEHHIVAVIALTEVQGLKRLKHCYYEDELLKMAGYKVFRYQQAPEITELKRDFLNAHIFLNTRVEAVHRDKTYQFSHVPM